MGITLDLPPLVTLAQEGGLPYRPADGKSAGVDVDLPRPDRAASRGFAFALLLTRVVTR